MKLPSLTSIVSEAISDNQRSKIQNIQPNDIITVYHGATLSDADLFVNGFDATQVRPRQYGGSRHAGLFVTLDPEVAAKFSHYGQLIFELEVRAKNLHGTDYSGNIGRKQDTNPDDLYRDKYPRSFRPYLSATMLQSHEPQALLLGLVRPNQIKRIYYDPSIKGKGQWYTREEF